MKYFVDFGHGGNDSGAVNGSVLEKNINKLDFYLNALCDNEGKIDIENIVSEMVDKVMQCDPFVLNTSFTGDITIGGGQIRCTIPIVNMDLVLNRSDIELFKNTMLNKNL